MKCGVNVLQPVLIELMRLSLLKEGVSSAEHGERVDIAELAGGGKHIVQVVFVIVSVCIDEASLVAAQMLDLLSS